MAVKHGVNRWLTSKFRQTLNGAHSMGRFFERLRRKQPNSTKQSKPAKTPKNACPINKCWQRPTVLIAAWVVLLVSSLSIASFAVTPFLRVLQNQRTLSLGWSGYVVISDPLLERPSVVGINGSWTVPTIAPSASSVYSSTWIGIGGHTDDTLIQCGTEHDSSGGKTIYSAWYELLPDYSITIPEIKVNAGDNITAAINLVDSAQNLWLVEITNLSNKQTWTQTFTYNSSRLSAEWVVERPQLNNQLTTLANFGTVTFTGISARMAGTQGTLTTFPTNEVTMTNQKNTELTTISELSSDGSSFTVQYKGS